MPGNEHGADAFVCQHFDQDGVRHAAVDDKDAVHAPADGVDAAGHFRQHAAVDDAGLDELQRVRRVDDGDERGGVVLVAQDAAAVKAQFAPNAIAAQPELDSQIEALLAYYNNETWEFEIPATGISESRNETGGTTRSYEMHSRIDGEKYYLVAMHAVVNDTTEPDNVGIWSLFLLHVDVPVRERYYIKGENDMVGIYVDLSD